jgi:hypothetical protein
MKKEEFEDCEEDSILCVRCDHYTECDDASDYDELDNYYNEDSDE